MTAGRLRRPLLTTAVLVVLTGCAGTDAPTSPAASTAARSSTTSAADPSSAAPASVAGQRIAVQVAGGQVSGDTGRVPVPVGDQVTLMVTSDVADEVHLHGYDLTAALTPGTPAELTFDATIPGVFEVELHEAGTVLLSLQVG
jgi:plastocyanin